MYALMNYTFCESLAKTFVTKYVQMPFILVYFSSKPIPIFAISGKGPITKWTTYKHKSQIKKEMSDCRNSVRRLSSVCSAFTAYSSLCRDLKYLLKVPYVILNCPNVAVFLIFKTLETLFGLFKIIALCLKKNITKIKGICVWLHRSSPKFHRICVRHILYFFAHILMY